MKCALGLTHDCNLSCEYCYTGEKFNKTMSMDTAEKIVDFVFDSAPLHQRIKFGFFGGEPLLRFDLLKDISLYISEKAQVHTNPVYLYVTTNGTILTKPILEYIEDTDINLCISIDGPAHVHNLNRRFKNGKGSHDAAVRGLKLALNHSNKVEVNAVYTPETITFLPESVEYLMKLGVRRIHLNMDIQAQWNGISIDDLKDIYSEISRIYTDAYESDQGVAINLIDNKILVFLKGGYSIQDRCGMGKTEWGFAPSGNVYPCERLISDDKDMSMCIGNVNTVLNLSRWCSFMERNTNLDISCKECSLRSYCMYWCGCTNYNQTGDIGKPGSFVCASEKAGMQSALRVLDNLKGNETFINHLEDYLSDACMYHQEGGKDG